MKGEAFVQNMAVELIMIEDPVVAAHKMYDFVERSLNAASTDIEKDNAQEYSLRVMKAVSAIDVEYADLVAQNYFDLTLKALMKDLPELP